MVVSLYLIDIKILVSTDSDISLQGFSSVRNLPYIPFNVTFVYDVIKDKTKNRKTFLKIFILHKTLSITNHVVSFTFPTVCYFLLRGRVGTGVE